MQDCVRRRARRSAGVPSATWPPRPRLRRSGGAGCRCRRPCSTRPRGGPAPRRTARASERWTLPHRERRRRGAGAPRARLPVHLLLPPARRSWSSGTPGPGSRCATPRSSSPSPATSAGPTAPSRSTRPPSPTGTARPRRSSAPCWPPPPPGRPGSAASGCTSGRWSTGPTHRGTAPCRCGWVPPAPTPSSSRSPCTAPTTTRTGSSPPPRAPATPSPPPAPTRSRSSSPAACTRRWTSTSGPTSSPPPPPPSCWPTASPSPWTSASSTCGRAPTTSPTSATRPCRSRRRPAAPSTPAPRPASPGAPLPCATGYRLCDAAPALTPSGRPDVAKAALMHCRHRTPLSLQHARCPTRQMCAGDRLPRVPRPARRTPPPAGRSRRGCGRRARRRRGAPAATPCGRAPRASRPVG